MGFLRQSFFLFLFIGLLGGARSQALDGGSDLSPFFRSWGASTFIDVINGPATTYESQAGGERFYQTEGFSYLTASFRGRINLVKFFSDMALSSSLSPATGASLFQSGYAHFNLPMLVNLEIGANSTKSANLKRFGLVAGIGYEFHAAPLIVDRSSIPIPNGTQLRNTWIQPTYVLGIRYKRGGQLMELNLKYGKGPGTFTKGRTVRARTIRVMAYYYI